MLLFNRIIKVIITNTTETIEIENLRTAFDIKKDDGSEQNKLELSIYNMSSTLKSKLEEKDLSVQVLAGYDGVAELIFKGDSTFVIHKKEGPDIVTKINAKDGGVAMRETMFTESFAAGTTVQQVIDKLTGAFRSVDVKQIAGDIAGSFSNGFSTTGPLKTTLNKLSESFGFDWSIQDNELQITKKNQTVDDLIIFLNESTGMVGAPEKLTKGGDELKEDPTVVPNGVSVTSLLLPASRPGRRLTLESNSVNGEFRINEVAHTGDTHGPKWHTITKAELI